MITNMMTTLITVMKMMVDLVPRVERAPIEVPKEGDGEVALITFVKKASG